MDYNKLHINNILKDMEEDKFQAYILTQFTNVEYILITNQLVLLLSN